MTSRRRILTERWRDVPGYEGVYQVSCLGRVRSSRFWKRRGLSSAGNWHLLGTSVGPNGHHFVRLFSEGKVRCVSLGKLMLLVFKGPDPDPQRKWACHRNGNPSVNLLGNLYWGTNSENQMDRAKHGTSNAGEANGRSVLTATQVEDIKHRIRNGERNVDIHTKYPHIDPSAISAIRIGRNWK